MTNRQIDLEGVTAVEDMQFLHLDKRYRSAHIAGYVLMYVLLMGLALLLILTERPWICIAAECAVLLVAVVNLSLLPKAYSFKGVALREHDITYRSGIIFPKITTIPYVRIQQVSVNQNPITRYFHLYSLEVTNGAQLISSLTIPGLTEDTANQIKHLVTEKLRNDHD